MEQAHSLLLNEEACSRLGEHQRPAFILEWLSFLKRTLPAADRMDVKQNQKRLVEQLMGVLMSSPGPPTRQLLAHCLAAVYKLGDPFLASVTVDKCTEIIRSKDDSPSFLPTRLAAIACLGAIYEQLGQLLGNTFTGVVSNLLKIMKSAESQGRYEIMLSVEKVLRGLGVSAVPCHRDVYKTARGYLTDRSMAVRCAAAKCLLELQREAAFLWTSELENVATACFRAFEGSSYNVRAAVSALLGTALAAAVKPAHATATRQVVRSTSLEDAMGLLSWGFLRGGGSFLRASGDMLKRNGSVSRDVRVGIAQACVVFVSCLGNKWLEMHYPSLLALVLELVSHPQGAQSPADAASCRHCVTFILRSTLGSLLSEKAQIEAAKEICLAVNKEKNDTDTCRSDGGVEARLSAADAAGSQHVLVCALQELGCLTLSLGSSAELVLQDTSVGMLDVVMSLLLHPSASVRLAAAWCLRCVAIALPAQTTVLLDRCAERLDALKLCAEAVVGYSAAIAALLGAMQHSPLGIPYAKGRVVLELAEELLRSASQNSRLALQRTQGSWLLLSAAMTLGPAVVARSLPRVLLLWKCTFPSSDQELEAERARGDAFTWQVTLEGRAAALCAMKSFIAHCGSLVNDEVTAHIHGPLLSAVAQLSLFPGLIKSYGNQMKTVCTVFRLRLYEVLSLLPPKKYEAVIGALLKQLVNDLAGPENAASGGLIVLLPLCHSTDTSLLGHVAPDAGQRFIDEQMHCGSGTVGGSLEHDPYTLCEKTLEVPTPLPPSSSVSQAAVQLFGHIFPYVAASESTRVLEQYFESLKHLKGFRLQTAQIHMTSAFCCALKRLGSAHGGLLTEDTRRLVLRLLLAALESGSEALRCAAADGLARLVQVTNDAAFTGSIAHVSTEKLKMARDAVTRTGHALLLGTLYRYLGGMSTPQHLSGCVGILFMLSQDGTSPEVQAWALHSLSLVIDCAGPAYHVHVESSFALVLRLLLSVPPGQVEVHQSLGRCLHALITALGPDLQAESSSISTLRSWCMMGCAVLRNSSDCLLQAQAVACLQELHMFAPRHVNLASLVPCLCVHVCSSYLSLRRAAVACLRQLAQREAAEVSAYAAALVEDLPHSGNRLLDTSIKETGLEGALFILLDQESDPQLCQDLRETLVHLLSSMAMTKLSHWLRLCKDVLSACAASPVEPNEDEEGEREDDDSIFTPQLESSSPFNSPRCSTRVFATECVCRIIALCESGHPAHFDLVLAQERHLQDSAADFLVLHLSDLVRMAFMAATEPNTTLRMSGLRMLLLIIRKFADVSEPEFPGHVILEQYQANVGAALRPAFAADTPPDITAMACQVCSAWIASGVVSDLSDLRRVHGLLTSSLVRVQAAKEVPSQLYNESTVTMETLAVLKAWAEVYIVAVRSPKQDCGTPSSEGSPQPSGSVKNESPAPGGNGLLKLVQADLPTLSRLWLAALQDHALLTLPQEYTDQLPAAGGAFYTAETVEHARAHYSSCWAPILHAAALWLNSTGFIVLDEGPANLSRPVTPTSMGQSASQAGVKSPEDINTERFHLILGISVEYLCSPHSDAQMENIISCLHTLQSLLEVPWPRSKIGNDQALNVELVSVLRRLVVTRESPAVQLAALELVRQVVCAVQERVREKRHSAEVDDGAAEKETLPEYGEGRDTGGLVPGRSLVFGALQLCLCVLLRRFPHLSPKLTGESPEQGGRRPALGQSDYGLISMALTILSELPSICSPEGSVSILPSVLYLTLGVFRELTLQPPGPPLGLAVSVALQGLRVALSSPMARAEKSQGAWTHLLRCALSTLLDFWDSGEISQDTNQINLLAALTVFLRSASPEVTTGQPLLARSISKFKTCLESKDPLVLRPAFQLLASVFQGWSPVAVPFIQTLGGPLVRCLQTVEKRRPQSVEEVQAVLSGVRALEALVFSAGEEHCAQLLPVLLHILVSFLLDENALPSASPPARGLHECALQDLTRLAPWRPSIFRDVLCALPSLRARLEAVAKGNQESVKARVALLPALSKNSPTVPLKTSFL